VQYAVPACNMGRSEGQGRVPGSVKLCADDEDMQRLAGYPARALSQHEVELKARSNMLCGHSATRMWPQQKPQLHLVLRVLHELIT
jgi:hypothetical protein